MPYMCFKKIIELNLNSFLAVRPERNKKIQLVNKCKSTQNKKS